MSHWFQMAYSLQLEALEELPADATIKQKSDAIRDAWPKQLGERRRWPYKVWLKVRREMLGLPKPKTYTKREKDCLRPLGEKQTKRAMELAQAEQMKLF